MPAEGLPLLPREELLSIDEVARLIDIGVSDLGIDEVRLTGGEPLVRRDLEKLVATVRSRHADLPIALTTNAVGLARRAHDLRAAGVTRLNISLDTVDAELFAQVTRRDRLADVVAGIDAARDAGFAPIKVNAVALRSTVSSASELLNWCIARGLELRFIENMPLDADATWTASDLITAADVLEELSRHHRLSPIGRVDPGAPAERWLVDDGPATVGIIASMTRPFCRTCDRTRITAEGRVRPCLFSDDEIDLRTAMRSGASDAEVAELWQRVTARKSAGHAALGVLTHPRRTMGAIGG
ncbi:molybdenum cofactor biosynthesis protein MoaA [Gordonia effusa NBRC 100432]|uniref:Molybdenum cofactor biosynthesis protein MoaA n=2 Tax=Gordonia effusa TaxID=263908 RepID=H0QYX0_9ACTN|nr:molybdenum cofactor biosynthesis protein MoaA [Gordonia effusa NBRC 100432]